MNLSLWGPEKSIYCGRVLYVCLMYTYMSTSERKDVIDEVEPKERERCF